MKTIASYPRKKYNGYSLEGGTLPLSTKILKKHCSGTPLTSRCTAETTGFPTGQRDVPHPTERPQLPGQHLPAVPQAGSLASEESKRFEDRLEENLRELRRDLNPMDFFGAGATKVMVRLGNGL